MVAIIKMSSKGQVVIPRDVRENINAEEGTIFAIVNGKDSVILKKISTPTIEELIKDLEEIAVEGRKNAEKLGIKESDVPKIIDTFRKSKK